MKDSKFKSAIKFHYSNLNCKIGEKIDDGYMPDAVVLTENGECLIFESEQKTDRKAFLGSFMKAEIYAEKNQINHHLIIVMREYKNTTVSQVARHLTPYVEWLSNLKSGTLSLKTIQIISDSDFIKLIVKRNNLISFHDVKNGRFIWPNIRSKM